MKIATVAQMRAMDQQAVRQFRIPEQVLMENAGLAAYAVLAEHTTVRGRRFVVLCGPGNNGGDGFVVARKLHSNGGRVKVFLLGDRKKIRGVSDDNLGMLEALAVDIRQAGDLDDLRWALSRSDVLVDAILGTGLSKDVGGLYRDVVDRINRSGRPVLSLDIPSGIHGDTGRIMGCAVRAAWTVTFGLPKPGNLLYPGWEACGRLYVTHISFPPAMTETSGLELALNRPAPLPPRSAAGHKGDFGDVLFIAGAAGYLGAPCFAALSFLKAGGGYARLAAPASIAPFLACRAGEVVYAPQKETASGSIALENHERLLALSEQTDMTVLGPGLSLDPETRHLVTRLVQVVRKPLILDGDGITAVCDNPGILRTREADTILTPHLGEMARLTRLSVQQIQDDPVGVLQRTAAEWNAHIVLKGAHSLIGLSDRRVFINLSGNDGMATAGSGDVLAGTVAAMFGLGLPVAQALCKGVFIHGAAGDLAAHRLGRDGITAQDILEHLPQVMKQDREGLLDTQDRYAIPCRV